MTRTRWLWMSLAMAAIGLLCYYFSFVSTHEIKSGTEKRLHRLERRADVYLDSIYNHLHNSNKRSFVNYLSTSYKNTFNEDGIACFIYENDSLQFWTDNRVAVENYMLNVCLEKRLVKLKNGYYEVIRHPKNAYSPFQLYALVLIKNAFPYENRYLKNEFNAQLNLPDGIVFNENEATNNKSIQITNYKNQTVFNLGVVEAARSKTASLLSFLFFCLSIFLILYFLKQLFFEKNKLLGLIKWKTAVLGAAFVFWLLLFRMDVLYVPASAFDKLGFLTLIFSLISTALLGWIFLVLRSRYELVPLKSSIGFFVLLSVIYAFGLGINFSLHKIFNRSFLSADLSDVVFSSSPEVYLSYLLVFLLLVCFVIFSETVLKIVELVLTRTQFFLFVGITATSVIAHHLYGKYDILTAIWPGLFFILLFVFKRLCAGNKFLYGILICLFISFFGAYLSIDQKNKADYEQRMNLAKQLASPKDEIAENLFSSLKNFIATDKELIRIIVKKDKSVGDVEQYVLKKYFTGYWDKYNVSVCVFDSMCMPLVQHNQHLFNNNTYFDELISTKLKLTDGSLYFNEQLKDKTFYLFKTPLETARKPHLLYLVIESKKTPEYRGFPDLLLNRSSIAVNS